MIKTLPIKMLEPLPKRVRALVKLDAETVDRYTEIYRDEYARKDMAQPVVFCEPGCERYVIADGEHRIEAAKRAKLRVLPVDLREGDQHDALAFALGSNARHGLPRRELDVWNAFCLLMDDPVLCDRFRTDQDKADAICASRRIVVKYKADYRDCEEWQHMLPAERRKRLLARRRKEREQQHSSGAPPDDDPAGKGADETTVDEPSSTSGKSRKPRKKKQPLTPEQKQIAQQVKESRRREKLDENNRKTFVSGLDAIRSIPHDGAEAAKRWTDIDEAQVRYVREWCDEFLREREKARAA